MTQARRTLVSVADTPFYHCIGRCVRRAFLCGTDKTSGRSYEHRRAWMRERLALLSRAFAIDICAYALMSNHYHLVLRLCPERVRAWSDEEVIARWLTLFAGPPLVRRYREGEALGKAELAELGDIVSEWRQRLSDLSWYMRCLNEHIARRANAEDGVTGHFWEARFKSQALLDDVAVLQSMVYVDLNPIRAAMATSIAGSAYTAAQQRFRALMGEVSHEERARLPLLAEFSKPDVTEGSSTLPFTLTEYLELVEATGRCSIGAKRGFISATAPTLITRLRMDEGTWLSTMRPGRGSRHLAIGSPENLRRFARRMLKRKIRGISHATALYST